MRGFLPDPEEASPVSPWVVFNKVVKRIMTTFPLLSRETLRAINLVGRWLAQDDAGAAVQADIIILAGNAVIPVIESAFRRAVDGNLPLVISGGIGHSTAFLYEAVAQHPRYHSVPVVGRTEAEILSDIAYRFWHIPQARICVESHSTNCGENAVFSRNLLIKSGLTPRRAIIVQDPTMQRRTIATFARAWRDACCQPQWLSAPGIVPELYDDRHGLHFTGGDTGLWSVERYLSLMLGEIPRLRDDINGYGPCGKDFIEHVTIPDEIAQAWYTMSTDACLTNVLRQRAML